MLVDDIDAAISGRAEDNLDAILRKMVTQNVQPHQTPAAILRRLVTGTIHSDDTSIAELCKSLRERLDREGKGRC